jgi:beta-glucosidase
MTIQNSFPFSEQDLKTISPEAIVNTMTLAEQVSILSGDAFWTVNPIDRLGIGTLRVTDGPNGARGSDFIGGTTAAAFPVGIAIGATWNPSLAYEIGSAIADEVKSKGAHVSLAPTVNIHRSVTNGRNFECYSEDPELTAALAVQYIKGLQDKGISATIKHFAGNESEIERTTMSSEIDERSLREVYLRPFEDAVKKAGTWGIMSSYNKINGTYAAEHHWLLTEVLRDQWGYDGIVMSDWFGSRTTAPTVNAGLDLEMPGPTRDRGDKLIAAVKDGAVSAETVRTRAINMVRLMQRVGSLWDHRALAEVADNKPEHRALIRRAGAEGAVLLKNDDATLPLSKDIGKVAVIGPNAKEAQIMGGGSAMLNPHYRVSPLDALVDRLGADRVIYERGCTNHRWEPMLSTDTIVEYFDNVYLSGDAVFTETVNITTMFWLPPFAGGKVDPTKFSARLRTKYTATETGPHLLGLHSAGYSRAFINGTLVVDAWTNWTKGRTMFEEGCDEITGSYDMVAGEEYEITVEFAAKLSDNLILSGVRYGISRPLGDAEIAAAAKAAASAEVALVFVGRNGEWDTEGSDLLDIDLPGRQDDLVRAVVAANPNTVVVLQTGGPVVMPWTAPAILQAWYPGQEAGNAITDILFGDAEPTGRLPQSFPMSWADNPTHSQDPEVYPGLYGKVRYEEGVFIGYRHYEKLGIDPMYAFGHGLGYTTFDMGKITATVTGDSVDVRVDVTNTGDRDGTTVVQIYVGEPDAPIARPAKQLQAFEKVTVAAGQTRSVSLSLSMRDFAYFDVANTCWTVTGGTYVISAGFSAARIGSQTHVHLSPATQAP